MESRSNDLSLPYGRVAMWGIAVSVVVTGAFLALSPCSPVQLAAKALDGQADLPAFRIDGASMPTAAEVSRQAVRQILGQGTDGEREPPAAWGVVAPELGIELGREWSRIVPELSAELSREWTRIAPELRNEMRREFRRELRGLRGLEGLRVQLDAPRSGAWMDGG